MQVNTGKLWFHKDCEISPSNNDAPKLTGVVKEFKNLFWTIHFPNGSTIQAETSLACIKIIDELEQTNPEKFSDPIVTVLQFLIFLRDKWNIIPSSTEGKGSGSPSNSELRRWLEKSSVLLNGKKPNVKDLMEWPITELFFIQRLQRNAVRWLDNSS